MQPDALTMLARPTLDRPQMVIAFTGWMDGGDVSTGTIDYLVDHLQTAPLAEIEPESFYIYNFPGSMEMSALFRPHTTIEDGLVKAYEFPSNTFHYSQSSNLILFSGKEPNVNWSAYVDCMFTVAREFDVPMIWFIGSVAGMVPHTRDARLYSTVSDESLKPLVERYGVRFSNYEGPASMITHMLAVAQEREHRMATLVAEIPAYVQGRNVRSIEAVIKRLNQVLSIDVNLGDLRAVSDDLEKKISEAVEEQPELGELIQKLEEDYDNEVFDTQMDDLKDWLHQKGVRLD